MASGREGQAGDRVARDRELFDRIAGEWARKDLHPAARLARRQRLEQTLAILPSTVLLNTGTALPEILEAGCGAGFTASYLSGRFRSYLGLDHSEELVQLARQLQDVEGATFEVADLERPLAGERRFDLILMIGVLHHLNASGEVVRKLTERLRPGGWLAVNEPQSANPFIGAARRLRKALDSAYSDDQLALSARAMRRQLEEAGLRDVRLRPQGLVSTPFAEIPLGPTRFTVPLVRLLCGVDRMLERGASWPLRFLSWNLVAAGRRAG
jgi:SAM-dependent methyltransferase